MNPSKCVRLLALAGGCLALAASVVHAADPTPIYLDPSRPVAERIDDLLPRMTLEEKILQLTDDWGCPAIPRLKIPALLKTEGLHGNSYSNGGTIFPEGIAMAATWDPKIVFEIGKATAVESKAAGIRQSWSPVLDVVRDGRWGRVEETYGEDPFLVSHMGVAWITGFQGEGMISTPKHFAGHGFPLGGRDSNDIGLSERTLREIELPPFRAAVEEAHAGGVMAAYGTWEGVPDNASKILLRGILREEWGFDGMVVTDCSAIEHFVVKHAITDNYEVASRLALEAGVNIECGQIWRKYLVRAVQDGLVSEAQVNDTLRPVLAAKFNLGLFDHPSQAKLAWDRIPAYDTPEHRALARQAATESMVLVKNDNKTLPLSRKLKTIAVIGPDAAENQTGDYSAKASPGQLSTVLEAIKARVAPGTQVIFAPGFDWTKPFDKGLFPEALDAARKADAVIMVMGDSSVNPGLNKKIESTTGENKDGATLAIPGAQEDLIKQVAALGKPLVLDIVNGKPFVLSWEDENVPAILISWYAGEEAGDATADLLFGDKNPSGRLPITFPRFVGQEPLTYDFKTSGRNYDYYDMSSLPLYRFGYGLSYTAFEYSNLKIAPDPKDPASVTVTAEVRNTGASAGDEVAQLYVTDLVAPVVTPIIQLKGFQRLSLQPGETKTATFHLTPYDLSLLNEGMTRVVAPGTFRIHVGGASPQPVLSNKKVANAEQKSRIGFKTANEGVTGEFREPQAYAARFVYTLKAPDRVQAGEDAIVMLSVKNEGNLTDVTQAKLYEGTEIGGCHFEIAPGETKTHTFHLPLYTAGAQSLAVVGSGQMVVRPITVDRAPAKLRLSTPVVQINDEGLVQLSAQAVNVGSDPFAGSVGFVVDGQPVTAPALKLAPGEQQMVTLSFQAGRSGNHTVRVGDLPLFNVTVPGGLGMAWGGGPALYLPLNEGTGASAKDAVTGKAFAVQGTPQWQDGGLVFSNEAAIPVGSIDLANRSFTLAAWVNVAELRNGKDAGFFGGKAPMGAGQDDAGSKLHAGVEGGKLQFAFFGRDVSGQAVFPLGQWVHVAYVYDHAAGRGTIYRDGSVDAQKSQKPYEGALETIGTTPMTHGGKFTMKDVLVLNGSLNNAAVKTLVKAGPGGLKGGQFQSEWRPAGDAAPAELIAPATLPAGSHVTLVVETGDPGGKVVDRKSVELSPGKVSYVLAGLKPGAQVRVRAEMTVDRWDASPVVASMTLKGSNLDLHWITPSQWKKGSTTGGVRLEE